MTIAVDIVTPAEKLASREADMVIVPGSQGEMGVLVNHAPVTTTLRAGVVQLFDALGKVSGRYFVAGGFAETDGQHCIILADEALDLAEYKRVDAEERLKNAQKSVEQATDPVQAALAEAELETAQTLLSSIS